MGVDAGRTGQRRVDGGIQLNWQDHPDRPDVGTRLCALAEIPDGGGREVAFGDGRGDHERARRLQEARGLASLYAQANMFDLQQAKAFQVEWTPRGWMRPDGLRSQPPFQRFWFSQSFG